MFLALQDLQKQVIFEIYIFFKSGHNFQSYYQMILINKLVQEVNQPFILNLNKIVTSLGCLDTLTYVDEDVKVSCHSF